MYNIFTHKHKPTNLRILLCVQSAKSNLFFNNQTANSGKMSLPPSTPIISPLYFKYWEMFLYVKKPSSPKKLHLKNGGIKVFVAQELRGFKLSLRAATKYVVTQTSCGADLASSLAARNNGELRGRSIHTMAWSDQVSCSFHGGMLNYCGTAQALLTWMQHSNLNIVRLLRLHASIVSIQTGRCTVGLLFKGRVIKTQTRSDLLLWVLTNATGIC